MISISSKDMNLFPFSGKEIFELTRFTDFFP
jgi:hypothetical protein